MMKIVLLIICLASIIHSSKVPENLEEIQMRVDRTVKQIEQSAEVIKKRILEQEIESTQKNQETVDINNQVKVNVEQSENQQEINIQQDIEQENIQSQQTNNDDVVSQVETIITSDTNENINQNSESQESQQTQDSNKEQQQEDDLCISQNCSQQNEQNDNTQEQQNQQSNEDQQNENDLEVNQIPQDDGTIEEVILNDEKKEQEIQVDQVKVEQEQVQEQEQEQVQEQEQEQVQEQEQEQEINNGQDNEQTQEQHQHHEHIHVENFEHVHIVEYHDHTRHNTHDHEHDHNHDHTHHHTHEHTHDHTHHYQQEEQTHTGQNLQNGWQVQLSFIPNFCQIKQKIINFQNQLPTLLGKYLPNSKQDQVNYSVLIVSFPSLPIFLLLLITVGIRNRGTTIQYMIAFSFGTMLGDVFFHMLPQILGTHSHDHHSHDHHNHDHHEHEHDNPQICLILGGVLLFAFVDLFIIKLKNLRGKRDESHDHEHNNSIIVFLFGDFLHNFTDGIALAATYSISLASGITTTIAIFMHEIPHEVGDFAYLLKQGKCVFVILSTQIFTSLGCLAGGYVGLHFAQTFQQELLCLTCGSFLYVALVNILPELKQSFSYRPKLERLIINLISIAAGLYLMKFVGQLE